VLMMNARSHSHSSLESGIGRLNPPRLPSAEAAQGGGGASLLVRNHGDRSNAVCRKISFLVFLDRVKMSRIMGMTPG